MLAPVSRRTALRTILAGAGGSLVATPVAADAPAAAVQPAAAGQPPGVCVLFPQAVEGPFYFDPRLVRADITEGRPGAPLDLVLRVIESGPCTPIAKARIDVWHADAGGIYSGYDGQGDDRTVSTKSATYLRGTQITDGDGRATFNSILPGWYPGRTPHIHLKVFLDEKTVLTGQVYFPEDLLTRIYQTRAPYSARPSADVKNADDFIFKSGERDGGGTMLAISETAERIAGTLLIAVDRSGTAASRAGGWGGWLRRWWPG